MVFRPTTQVTGSKSRYVNRAPADDLASGGQEEGKDKLDQQTTGLLRALQQLDGIKGHGARSRLIGDIISIAKTKKMDPSALVYLEHERVLGSGRESMLDSFGPTASAPKVARRAAAVDSDASFSDVGSDDEYETGEDDWYLSQYTQKKGKGKQAETNVQEEIQPTANDSLIEEEDLHIVAFGAKSFLDEIGGQSVGTETVKQTQHERALRKENRQNSTPGADDALLPEVEPDSPEAMYGSSLPERYQPNVQEVDSIKYYPTLPPQPCPRP